MESESFSRKWWRSVLMASLLAPVGAWAQSPPPVPTEFTVNVPTGTIQEIAAPTGGDILVKTGDGTLNLLSWGALTGLKAQGGLLNLFAAPAGTTSTVLADGGNVTFNLSQTLGALTVQSGSKVELALGGDVVLETALLSVDATADSALDLQDNTLIVTYTGDSPLPNLNSLVTSGLCSGPNGFWDGPGIRSSAAAAVQANYLRAVAVVDNNYEDFAILAEFPIGHAIGQNSVIVTYTWFGDANLDKLVTGDDYQLIDTGFFGGEHGWLFGDFNYDGVIDGDDYGLLDTVYFTGIDTDGDGTPDTSDAYPLDYFNGQTPLVIAIGGNGQWVAPETFAGDPLVVRVTVNGQPAPNAPVAFSTNAGYLAGSTSGALRTSLHVQTNAQGEALVYARLPGGFATSATITAVATSANGTNSVVFNLFSTLDSDFDAMPDAWEYLHGLNMNNFFDAGNDPDGDRKSNLEEFLQGTDPNDPFNGIAPSLQLDSGQGQFAWRNGVFFDALSITITNSDGVPMSGTSVSFAAPNCAFSEQRVGSPFHENSLICISDEFGRAQVYCRAPDSFSSDFTVSASVVGWPTMNPIEFSEQTLDNPQGKAAPGNPEIHVTPTGDMELTWTDEADGETAYVIERVDVDEEWRIIAKLHANSTSFSDHAKIFLTPSVKYRVTATGP